MFIPGIFFWCGIPGSPPQKNNLKFSPSKRLPNCVCPMPKSFFGRDINYKYITEFLLMGNKLKHRKLAYSSFSNQKCADLCLKCTKNTFGGRVPLGPAGGAGSVCAPQTSLAAMGAGGSTSHAGRRRSS